MTKKSSVLPLLAVFLLATTAGCAKDPATDEPNFPTASQEQTSESGHAPEPTRGSPVARESTSETEKNTAACSLDAIHENPDYDWVNTISDCDGSYLVGGQAQTDHVEIFYVDDGEWKKIDRGNHETVMSGFPCFPVSTLDQHGVPDAQRQRITVCEDTGSTSGDDSAYVDVAGLGEWYEPVSMPACDGRNILIVNSIHVPGNSRAELQQEIGKAIMHDNELKYTIPGKCSSLRAQIDGQDIYPIYYDFGDDQQAMCEAKAVHGGNGRTLNNSGDFSDPC